MTRERSAEAAFRVGPRLWLARIGIYNDGQQAEMGQ